jgi:hypothetical protein
MCFEKKFINNPDEIVYAACALVGMFVSRKYSTGDKRRSGPDDSHDDQITGQAEQGETSGADRWKILI